MTSTTDGTDTYVFSVLVAQIVAAAPPLAADQRDRIASLLRAGRVLYPQVV